MLHVRAIESRARDGIVRVHYPHGPCRDGDALPAEATRVAGAVEVFMMEAQKVVIKIDHRHILQDTRGDDGVCTDLLVEWGQVTLGEQGRGDAEIPYVGHE